MNIANYTRQAVLNTGNKINTYAVKEKYAQTIIKAVQQGLISKNNKGIQDKFVASDEVKKTSRILVLRQIPHDISPRKLGDTVLNGGYGDERAPYIASTENVWIDCLNYYDRAFVVPEIQENLIDIDVMAGEMSNYEIQLVLDMNGGTLAKRLEKSLFGGTNDNVKVWSSGDKITKPIGQAITQLMRGDREHGFGYFPESSMLCGISLDAYDELLSNSVLVGGQIGTYNEKSQEMIAKGVISPDAVSHFEEDGYVGVYRNVEFHIVSDSVLDKAEQYLGLDSGALLGNGFVGFVGTSYANARGISALKDLKVLDYQGFRGKLIQPLINYGVEVFYPKGNVFIFSDTTVNLTDIKTLFPNTPIQAKPVGSRVVPLATLSGITTAGFTATITAENSNESGVVETDGVYLEHTSSITSVKDFLELYGKASTKGTFTSGSAVSETLTSGSYVCVLVASKDGTFRVFSGAVEGK